jgi:wyosine [tRNA(Phe)-imidazoG37] synthetase (radical SAM superfamily)
METVASLYADHSRLYRLGSRNFVSVYPVLSRRARGISVGINLNLDKACNFDCIYCQVDRTTPGPLPVTGKESAEARAMVDLVTGELATLFGSITDGTFFHTPPFDRIPPEFKVVRDIAFSGDGEPTLAPSFREVGEAVRRFVSQRSWGADTPPLLRLITNGSGLFGREARAMVRRVFLEEGKGEIWLKLDCGDPSHFDRINRSTLSFDRTMEGLDRVVFDLPVTIQTMVLDYPEEGKGGFVSDRSFWIPLRDRVLSWSRRGARIEAWHLYSVARPPAVSGVARVPGERLESWAAEVRPSLPFPVLVFP